MNLCKRACLYSIRKKDKTLTLLAFLLVMATLMLTCLSIQSATEIANANLKKALLGYFTINAKMLKNGIPEDTVSQILDVDGLSGRYTLRSYTYATYFDADGNLLEINTEGVVRCRRAMRMPDGWRPTPTPRRTAISPTAALKWWRAILSPQKQAARC